MRPVLFSLAPRARLGRAAGGVPSIVLETLVAGQPPLYVSGVTRDATGAALGGCTVRLVRASTQEVVETLVSDGAGAFTFRTVGLGQRYQLQAYLPGSPDVAGASVNTLEGTASP